MRPYYIILTETGERVYIADAYEFNENEFDLTYEFDSPKIGFCFSPDYPEESFCYTPDIDPDGDEPITATTLGFIAYDEAGNVVCQDEGGGGMWL